MMKRAIEEPTDDYIKSRFVDSYESLLVAISNLGFDTKHDANFDGTPDRCARAILEILSSKKKIEEEVKRHLKATFPSKADEMVVQTNIEVISVCPHHLLPVEMIVNLAYIPNGRVIGLSKLVRIARVIGRQPVLQEDYAQELASTLMGLNPKGVGVFVKGKHGCMRFRGVRTKDGHTVTTCVRGAFRDQQATREEFLELCRHA
jgi:GTP cyclohydrolase IA